MSAGGASGGSAGRIAGVAVAWAIVHSALASRQAKGAARRLVGPRRRNGLYRLAYVLQSFAATGAFALWFVRQPDRDLYRVRAPLSWLLYAGQLASLGVVFATLWAVGPTRISGLASFAQFVTGHEPEPEPEAQGPAPGPDGALRAVGPFRHTRHPDNLPILGVFWLFPRMTVNRATLAALGTVYAGLGSIHEDRRLGAAYGAAFAAYRRRYPFFWPRLGVPDVADESAGGDTGARGCA
jgi:hypothetical protein